MIVARNANLPQRKRNDVKNQRISSVGKLIKKKKTKFQKKKTDFQIFLNHGQKPTSPKIGTATKLDVHFLNTASTTASGLMWLAPALRLVAEYTTLIISKTSTFYLYTGRYPFPEKVVHNASFPSAVVNYFLFQLAALFCARSLVWIALFSNYQVSINGSAHSRYFTLLNPSSNRFNIYAKSLKKMPIKML